jgi:4-carboxymuconolactone decarboxylase
MTTQGNTFHRPSFVVALDNGEVGTAELPESSPSGSLPPALDRIASGLSGAETFTNPLPRTPDRPTTYAHCRRPPRNPARATDSCAEIDGMQIVPRMLLLAGAASILVAQNAGPPTDIFPDTLSRFPPVNRADLDENGKRVFDYVAGKDRKTPLMGPGGVSLHSPKAAEPIQMLNQYLRNEGVIGRHFFEVCALIGAREYDQQYEWSGHEPAALSAGVPQSVIDAIKYNKETSGLPEKDATVIQMGRELLRQHKLSSALFARSVQLFGRQGTLELATTIGDYIMAGIILTAADQQLPPDRKPLLPLPK